MTMSIPVWVLLAFAVWSMLVLILTVGIYRWGLIFAGRVQVKEFRADLDSCFAAATALVVQNAI